MRPFDFVALAAALPLLGGDAAPLERALSAVRPQAIAADVRFLASETLAGRDTPSRELEIAAGYVENRVRRLALEAGARGSWAHGWSLVRVGLTGESRLELDGAKGSVVLAPLDGFLWLAPLRRPSDAEGPAIAVGSADRHAIREAGEALDGAWAVSFGEPRRWQSTRRRLARAGALGLLVVPTGRPALEEEADRLEETTLDCLAGDLRPGWEAEEEERDLLPVLRLTATGAAALRRLAEPADERPGARLALRVRERRVARNERVVLRNVCALLRGADPERAHELIVCTAHYDHVGVVDGVIHPGADDNASGSAGLLALAEALAARGPLDRSVLFVWLSGEEKGLWGAEAFCRDLPLEDGMRIVANVNLDMIGRTAPDELYVTPSVDHERHGPIAALAYEHAAFEGFAPLKGQDEYFRASDHYRFADQLGVPVVFLSTGDHPDYHQPGDTAERVDSEKLARVVRTVLRMLEASDAVEFAPEAR